MRLSRHWKHSKWGLEVGFDADNASDVAHGPPSVDTPISRLMGNAIHGRLSVGSWVTLSMAAYQSADGRMTRMRRPVCDAQPMTRSDRRVCASMRPAADA